MKYDVVISTLNRAESLKASLLLLEAQSEPPNRIIVVDASDDHDAILRVVEPAIDRARFDYRFIPTKVKNLPFQRNLGLEEVENEIVFMPDDDSMFYKNSAAEIMAAYRADTDEIAGGVRGHNAASPPGEAVMAYKRQQHKALKERLQPTRNKLEELIAPKPFITYARELWAERGQLPQWLDGSRFAPVETIGGYLMTLRTEVARELRFNDVLGYGIGYALHEDMDMGIRIQKSGRLLVAALNAPIYHNYFPSKRAAGFNYGFCHIANYIYVCCKSILRDTDAWRQLPRFMRYKLFLYRLAARNEFGRDVLRGARAGWGSFDALVSADPSALDDVYRSLCDRFIIRHKPK